MIRVFLSNEDDSFKTLSISLEDNVDEVCNMLKKKVFDESNSNFGLFEVQHLKGSFLLFSLSFVDNNYNTSYIFIIKIIFLWHHNNE